MAHLQLSLVADFNLFFLLVQNWIWQTVHVYCGLNYDALLTTQKQVHAVSLPTDIKSYLHRCYFFVLKNLIQFLAKITAKVS